MSQETKGTGEEIKNVDDKKIDEMRKELAQIQYMDKMNNKVKEYQDIVDGRKKEKQKKILSMMQTANSKWYRLSEDYGEYEYPREEWNGRDYICSSHGRNMMDRRSCCKLSHCSTHLKIYKKLFSDNEKREIYNFPEDSVCIEVESPSESYHLCPFHYRSYEIQMELAGAGVPFNFTSHIGFCNILEEINISLKTLVNDRGREEITSTFSDILHRVIEKNLEK